MTDYSMEQEYEDKVILEFQNACLNNEFYSVIQFINNEKFRKIITDKENKEVLSIILKTTYQNNGKEFIKNLISNEILVKNNLSILFIKKLIEIIDKDKLNELINFFINDEKISKIIKDSIILHDEENYINNILIYACMENHEPNYEFLAIKILENKEIIEILLNDDNGEKIINLITEASTFSYKKGITNVNIIERILKNKDIAEKIYNNEFFTKLFITIPSCRYINEFDIFFSNDFFSKIDADDVNTCFKNSINKKRKDILEKLLDSKLVEKIGDEFLLNCFANACKNNKIEIIDLLVNNNTILNKIISNSDKLVNCFKVICNNKFSNIINLLLSKQQIKETIGENKIRNEIEKISFLTICNYDDISVAEEFIISKPNILTEEIINKLNEDKTPLLYNILNRDSFNEKDIKVAQILIDKGLKINETSKIVRRNINKLIEYLDNDGKNLKKQHFGIINEKKLGKTEEAIKKIKTFINMKKSTNDFSENSKSNNIIKE